MGNEYRVFGLYNDGDLDLYVVNYIRWSVETEIDCYGSGGAKEYCSPNNYRGPAKDILYRNNGDGTFTDVSQNAGLHAAFGNGLGVVTGDFNEDGFIDVFVANDQTNDQLWLNQGDGTFLDLGLYTGTAVDQDGIAKAGMGVAAEDYDNDRDLDLLVVNLEGQTDSFFRNDGPYFTDHTALSGLGTASRHFTRFGVGFADFDNDGWLDIYEANGRVVRRDLTYSDDPYAEPNLLFQGTSDGRFEEVLPKAGTRLPLPAIGRAAVFGDVDNDGGIDVLNS